MPTQGGQRVGTAARHWYGHGAMPTAVCSTKPPPPAPPTRYTRNPNAPPRAVFTPCSRCVYHGCVCWRLGVCVGVCVGLCPCLRLYLEDDVVVCRGGEEAVVHPIEQVVLFQDSLVVKHRHVRQVGLHEGAYRGGTQGRHTGQRVRARGGAWLVSRHTGTKGSTGGLRRRRVGGYAHEDAEGLHDEVLVLRPQQADQVAHVRLERLACLPARVAAHTSGTQQQRAHTAAAQRAAASTWRSAAEGGQRRT